MADRHHALPMINGCKNVLLPNASVLLRLIIVAASFLFCTIGHLSGNVTGAAAPAPPSRPGSDAATNSPSRQSMISTRIRSTDPPLLRADYYKHSCPHVEKYVRHAVKKATKHDPKAPAGLLRMHFHDCFIEGCDGSILLDSTANNTAEKDAPPNLSLHAFDVIDNAKAKIESACPNVVSCADILAIAARDAVVLSGGPHWDVLKGRKDGKVSNASETRGLPAPTFNVSQLIQSFALRNLSKGDMVTLSGGHTLGFSHCSSFNTRLFHFNTVDEVDPTIEDTFAHTLRMKCPEHNRDHAAGAFLDSTATKFDNQYYVDISQGRGLFSSDQSLFSQQVDPEVKASVLEYAHNETTFFHNFAISMVNMGNVGIKSEIDGEIRHNCHFVNPTL